MKINKIPLILLQCRSKLCIGILLIQTEICIVHAEVQLEQEYEVMSPAPPINSLWVVSPAHNQVSGYSVLIYQEFHSLTFLPPSAFKTSPLSPTAQA